MTDFALLVKAEFRRDLIFMQRYPLEILSFLFFMYLILLSIVLGVSQLLGPAAKEAGGLQTDRMIIGYCLMQFILATQMGWSGQIQNESQTGTLEQLSLSGHSLAGVLLARGIAQMPRQILSFFLLLGAYNLSIDTPVQTGSYYTIILILPAIAIGVYGVAFLFAGITLLFKRVGIFFQIINFAFLGLFWQNRDSLDGWLAVTYDWFPLTAGMKLLYNSLVNSGESTTIHFAVEWLFLLGVSVCLMLPGYAAFRLMEKRARKAGLLSQY